VRELSGLWLLAGEENAEAARQLGGQLDFPAGESVKRGLWQKLKRLVQPHDTE
jgi:hypothetical protein